MKVQSTKGRPPQISMSSPMSIEAMMSSSILGFQNVGSAFLSLFFFSSASSSFGVPCLGTLLSR